MTAVSEGYPYPTNLDRDQPVGSINPESQSDLIRRGLRENWDTERAVAELQAQAVRHLTS